MTYSAVYEPGAKTHKDENFPVASFVIRKEYRGAVLAFYHFARAADDVADHPTLSEKEKIIRLNEFEVTVLGTSEAVAEAVTLREALRVRNLTTRHALDLLIAFRQDASKARYKDWDELLHYCAYSAAPVGRFVLEVHGENPSTWPASDALCSALQIINHLQDCKADYQRLNRIYIPQDILTRHNVSEAALAEAHSSPALRNCLTELVEKTQLLMAPWYLPPQAQDKRLRFEVLTIQIMADRLLEVLKVRDPLGERVHLTKLQFMSVLMRAALATFTGNRKHFS